MSTTQATRPTRSPIALLPGASWLWAPSQAPSAPHHCTSLALSIPSSYAACAFLNKRKHLSACFSFSHNSALGSVRPLRLQPPAHLLSAASPASPLQPLCSENVGPGRHSLSYPPLHVQSSPSRQTTLFLQGSVTRTHLGAFSDSKLGVTLLGSSVAMRQCGEYEIMTLNCQGSRGCTVSSTIQSLARRSTQRAGD